MLVTFEFNDKLVCFFFQHPGGEEVMLEQAGKDCQ